MLDVFLNVLVPVLACVIVGFVWGKVGADFPNEFITRIVTYIGAPCLIVSTLKKSDLDWQLLITLGQSLLIIMAGVAGLGYIILRASGKPFRALSLAVVFPNTGNIGLPLCMFAFGDEGLAIALLVFVLVALVHFAVGDFVLSAKKGFRNGLLTGARQPIFLATLFVIFQFSSGFELPKPVLLTTQLLGGITIPLMLVTLGVSLSVMTYAGWHSGLIVSLVRVFGGLAVALFAVWLVGVEGTAAKVLIIQSAMPTAVFNYFFALKYQQEVASVASAVMISTVLSMLMMVPVLWYLLEQWP
jgi:malate permease and related proteins